jgi:uncharacterized protein YutE (UPF0331/DUF86 family)
MTMSIGVFEITSGGFRNILAHDYLGEIDPHTVLKVIDRHLNVLEAAVVEMLCDEHL